MASGDTQSARQQDKPNPIDVYVGRRVRLRRTLLGMSEEKLGEAIGLTFQQVQKYERGAKRITAERLYDLSKVLDVDVGYFFEEMGDDDAGYRDRDSEDTTRRRAISDFFVGLRTQEQTELKTELYKLLEINQPTRRIHMLRMLRSLNQISASVAEKSLVSAVSAPTDLQVVLRTLEDSGVFADVLPDDPLAAARLRGATRKAELLREHGGSLSAPQVAKLLGISRQAVDKRRQKGTLFAVELGRAGYTYPVWQFTDKGVLPGLRDVLAAFSVTDPWTKLNVLLTADPRLDGRTPLEALQAGDVELSRRAVAAYGEHGAP